MNIAIIGANGFLGNSLTRKLVSLDHTVYAVYRMAMDKIPEGCLALPIEKLYELDIYFDIIYLTLGNFNNSRSEFIAQTVEMHSALSLLRFNKVVLSSSVAVFGSDTSTIDNQSAFGQPSVYGLSKIVNEFFVSKFSNYSILRFTYIYGLGMAKNSLIPKWIDSALRTREIVVLGDGSRVQDYLHVSDAVDLFLKSGMGNQCGALIGATGQSISNARLAQVIANNIPGCKILMRDSETSSSFRYDVSETHKRLGWRPKVTIETGIQELIGNENSSIR